jgi:hypothetical protein
MGLQVCKAHLDPFSQIARFEEGFGLHFSPRHVTGILVKITRDLARLDPCAALRSQRVCVAVVF